MHLFPNVCSIGGHGALTHCTATLAQTGAYSIVQTVSSSSGFPETAHPSSVDMVSSVNSKHLGSAGVSQYISVQTSGLPSLTLHVLQPSK